MSTTHHCCLSIVGTLATTKNIKCFFDNVDEGRAYLKQCLAEGKKVLPIGDPCEGFSYETGCPGHPTATQGGE